MQTKHADYRILGVDPGLIVTGLGVVRAESGRCIFAGAQIVSPPVAEAMAARLNRLYEEASSFIAAAGARVMVVEKLIYARNAQVALKLGHARGVLLLAAARAGIPVVEYTPREIKLAVSGNGAASKQQVQRMVQAILSLPALPEPHDVADALALAICHAHRVKAKA
ncbi:MAG: crossover junction endodeoxyribonuclease RuvC [bacterium]